MREQAAGRDVDRVDAGLDQPVADLHRFVDGVAGGPMPKKARALLWSCALIFICRWKSVPTRCADRPHDLEDEAGAVLERAAVLVVAIVDRRAEELGDQVAVGAVQLDAVEPGLARAPRAFGERLDRLVDVGASSSARTRSPWSGSGLSVELRPIGNSIPGCPAGARRG